MSDLPIDYNQAAEYWEKIEPSVNGMLGGFSSLTNIDARDSLRFLNSLKPHGIQPTHACDCGAGIGRVTEVTLSRFFNKIDIVEQNPAFVEKAKEELDIKIPGKVDKYIAKGLQDFVPENGRYSVIWCQWVLSHLTDDDLVAFFQRCKKGLVNETGFICIKENVTHAGYAFDDEDSSVTRSEEIYKEIFKKAGLTIIKESEQTGFPENLYKVKMYALR